MKKTLKAVFVLMVVALMVASCAPAAATEAPAATEAAATEAATAAATTAAQDPKAVCDADPFGCATFKPGEDIVIGMGAPMTGGNASFGIDISQGATVAVEDGGDVNGWKIKLDAEDDQGSAEGGAAVANKFVSDSAVVAIAGHIFSGATAAAMPIYEKAGIPMLSPSATNPPLTQQGSKVFNRIAFTDAQQGDFAAKYLHDKLGFTKIAVMHDGTDYGKGLAEIVAAKFKEAGGEVVSEEAVTPGETDFTAVLSTVAATKPQAIYFGGYIAEGSVLVNEMDQTGLGDAVFFGCDGTYGDKFIENTGANGEGAYAVSLAPADTDPKLAFDKKYLDEFGTAAGTLSPYTWNGYDATAALISVIKSAAFVGTDGNLYIPRSAMVSGVRNLKGYVGLSGTYTCDATGECNASGPLFVVVKDGKWVPAQ
jgi:branched-chain amino acid transport system substrate-binding protein